MRTLLAFRPIMQMSVILYPFISFDFFFHPLEWGFLVVRFGDKETVRDVQSEWIVRCGPISLKLIRYKTDVATTLVLGDPDC